MVYATGDTHGDFRRFAGRNFPERADMTKEDFVIICGDFGGIWDGGKKEGRSLDWLEQLPFTVLFVSGNHENYDLLSQYPLEEWHGGKVQKIRPHVIHLCRGQVFELEGCTFFTMGGASSHDAPDGILDPADPDYHSQLNWMRWHHGRFRVNHLSWWARELPDEAEYAEARRTLERVNHQVDYIVTHCAPTSVQVQMGRGYFQDQLTDFLEEVRRTTRFRSWLFGHYHDNRRLEGGFVLLYDRMVKLL